MSFLPPPASAGLEFATLLGTEQKLPSCSAQATQREWDLLHSSQLSASLPEMLGFLHSLRRSSCVAELLPKRLTGQGWMPLLSQLSGFLLNWSEELQNLQKEGKARVRLKPKSSACSIRDASIHGGKTAATPRGSSLTTHHGRLLSCQGVLTSNT